MPPIQPYDYNTRYTDVTLGFATEAAKTLRASLTRIHHCLAQLSEDQLWHRPNPKMNAIGNLLLHLAGNLEQWALAPIENRPTTRNRPAEFAQRDPIPKSHLQQTLDITVESVASAIETLKTPADLLKHCEITGVNDVYKTDLLSVLFHAVSHFEGHTQEIIYATRLQLGDKYQFQWGSKPAASED
jgi:uncharacterized damage-inducible protein DinB